MKIKNDNCNKALVEQITMNTDKNLTLYLIDFSNDKAIMIYQNYIVVDCSEYLYFKSKMKCGERVEISFIPIKKKDIKAIKFTEWLKP